jgi:hypothetical protein
MNLRATPRGGQSERNGKLQARKAPDLQNRSRYTCLGDLDQKRNNFRGAEQACKKAIRNRPGYWTPYNDEWMLPSGARTKPCAAQFVSTSSALTAPAGLMLQAKVPL